MAIPRTLDLLPLLKKKSIFLFGPRQVGKTWLIKHALPRCRTYDLLDSRTYLKLNRSPERLEQELRPEDRIVVLDEIQKVPHLLDEVHRLIESRGIHFLLTGSSARKLRRGGVNLLGGRARTRTLHPFTYRELGERFDLIRALDLGLLPAIYLSDEPREDLQAYAGTYLQQEVAAEGLTRNIPAFSRFLEVAALCNGQMLNFAKIANDAQVARTTVQEYFSILQDTLLAYELPAWGKTRKRKATTTSKFFFFDVGVARFLQGRRYLEEVSPEFGEAMENYIFHELRTFIDYRGWGSLAYWRSKSGFEVDFILDDAVAIEVKGTRSVSRRDLRGLHALREERNLKRYLLVCREETPLTVDGIEVLPWNLFLQQLWDGVVETG